MNVSSELRDCMETGTEYSVKDVQLEGGPYEVLNERGNKDCNKKEQEDVRDTEKKDSSEEEVEETEDEDSKDGDELFCICRSADIDRFMIACDKCMEWFHGDCVNIENKRAARKIEEWYCQRCLELYDGLHIVYKEKQSEEKKKKSTDKENPKKKKIESNNVDQEKQDESSKNEDKDEKHIKRKRKNSDALLRRKNRTCGECASCTNQADCGKCDFCADMKKFGGPGKLRQKCRAKQCLFLSRVRKKDDQVQSEKRRKTKELVTDGSNDSTSVSSTMSSSKSQTSFSKFQSNNDTEQEMSTAQQDHCYSAPCQQQNNVVEEHTKKKSLKVKRATGNKMGFTERSSEPVKNEIKPISKKETLPYHDKLATNRTTRSSRKEREVVIAQQCLGPGCVNSARLTSKYCSSECGIQLQIRRLQVILPTRMKSLIKGYHATHFANEKIKGLRLIQKKCQDELVELDKQCHSLEDLLEKSKGLSIRDEEENDEERDTDLDLTTYCVSCGVALAPRIAFKHMEKCWAKVECLMSFGAVMRSAGNLFCDSYMSVQGTYCKRLKVMCPEHFKEMKVDSDMVCGCPLVDNEWRETGMFCRISKRKCARHVSWYRLRRGEIDLRRVHQWWKLEDALEQERQLRFEISKRNDVVGILLHNTVDHSNILERETYEEKITDVTLPSFLPLESLTAESIKNEFNKVDR